jgi:hypothetical protein
MSTFVMGLVRGLEDEAEVAQLRAIGVPTCS